MSVCVCVCACECMFASPCGYVVFACGKFVCMRAQHVDTWCLCVCVCVAYFCALKGIYLHEDMHVSRAICIQCAKAVNMIREK